MGRKEALRIQIRLALSAKGWTLDEIGDIAKKLSRMTIAQLEEELLDVDLLERAMKATPVKKTSIVILDAKAARVRLDKTITESKNLSKEKAMKVTPNDVKKVVKVVVEGGEVSKGYAVVMSDEKKCIRTVTDPNGKIWNVQGDKRMVVTVTVEKVVKKCEKCGKEFEPGRFTPYQKYCPDCSGKRTGGEPKPDKLEMVCETCGNKFMGSKFLPYLKTCPDCRGKVRKDKAKVKSAVKSATTGSKKISKVKDTSKINNVKETFEQWQTAVDDIIEASIGVTTDDLPDRDYRGSFEAGKPAEQMAEEVITDSEAE